MFKNILTTVSNQLEGYIKNRLGSNYETPILINKLINEDGSSTLTNANSIVLTLVNIQQENIMSRVGSNEGGSRPIHLNLYVLFSACFTAKYLDSFDYLSAVLHFFQTNPVLNHSNSPELDPSVSKLTFEIENLDTAAMSQLWGAMGTKHLPFILYKIRMVTIHEEKGGGSSTFTSLN